MDKGFRLKGKIYFSFATVLFMLLTCFLIAEAFLRFILGLGDPLLYENDQDIGLVMKPNQQVIRRHNYVYINNEGFREAKDIAVKKPDNEYRIFFLGDSVAYGGNYIKDNETFSSLIEKKLNSLNTPLKKNRHYDSINAAVNSHSVMNMLRVYQKKVLKYQPDLLVVTVIENDLYRNFTLLSGEYCQKKPALAILDFGRYLLYKIKAIIKVAQSLHIKKLFNHNDSKKENVKGSNKILNQNIKALREIITISQDNNVFVWVVLAPGKAEVYQGKSTDYRVENRLRNVCSDANTGFYVLNSCLASFRNKKLFIDDMHYSKKGHYAVADCLFPELLEKIKF